MTRHRDRQNRQVRQDWPDRGSSTVELVIATPLMLFMLMLVVQFSIWAHAEHIARAAANSGAQAARAYRATPRDGTRQARAVLDHSAGSILTAPRVTTDHDAGTAIVTVTGHAATVVPGLHLPVRAQVAVPRELLPGQP